MLIRDVIPLIVEHLSCWDALQFRQTCTFMNESVILCQTYWYQQFTWFLITQNKRVALFKTACKRVHDQRYTNCNTDCCVNPTHFIFDVPLDRRSIPIDPIDFNPSQQKYIYRFLIHKYRQRRAKAKGFMPSLVNDRRNAKRKIAHLEIELEKAKKQLLLLDKMESEQKLIKANTIFFGRKSRQYKTKPNDDVRNRDHVDVVSD